MDIPALLKELKEEIIKLIKDKFDEENEAIRKEISQFLKDSESKLERWSQLLKNQEITPSEFEILLQSQKETLQMKSLHKAGITAIKISHFKNAVLKLVLNKVLLFVGI